MNPDQNPISATPPAAPREVQHSVFFGRFGFRAGWGILIFLIVATLLIGIGSVLAVAATGHMQEYINARTQAAAHPGLHTQSHLRFELVALADGIPFLGMMAYCWLISRAERRPLAAFGIGRRRLLDFLPGALWGIVSMSCLVALLRSLHFLVFDGRALYGPSILFWGAKWLLAFLLVGFCEEYEFRGYLLYTLMRGFWGLAERLRPSDTHRTAFWLAGVTMSLLFGGLHMLNGGENAFGISQVVLVGLVFCYALWRTGSLWWGIGFHATWDWAQSFLFGVADSGSITIGRLFNTHPQGKPLLSGGSDGPEGSLFVVPFVLITLLVIHYTTTSGDKPSPEQLPDPYNLPPEPHTLIA